MPKSIRLLLPCLAALLALSACASTPKAAADEPGSAPFQGAAVRYDDLGPENANASSEPALVFIHGWASGREFWFNQTVPFMETRRVIAIDLPGHGESDEPAGAHSMNLYADAIAAVLDDASVQRAVLIGHSNGTPTIRQFYRRHPERVAGLVAVDGALKNVFPVAMAEPMLQAFQSDDYLAFAERSFAPMASRMANPAHAEMVMKRLRATPQRTLVGGLKAGMDDSIWISDRVRVPLLVINAPNPMLWTPEYETYVATLADDLEYVKMPGVSHFLMMDDPQTFNAHLERWLEAHGW